MVKRLKEEKENQVYEIILDVVDVKDWGRVYDYLASLKEIQRIKNEDSEASIEGGALCGMVIKIKVIEAWT